MAGCAQVDDALIQDRALLWLGLSLLLVGLPGLAAVFRAHLAKLRSFDLDRNTPSPDFARDRNVLIAAVSVLVLVFALYNWFSGIGIPPDQQWQNIFGWAGGSVAGGLLAHFAGRRLAVRRFHRQATSEPKTPPGGSQGG